MEFEYVLRKPHLGAAFGFLEYAMFNMYGVRSL